LILTEKDFSTKTNVSGYIYNGSNFDIRTIQYNYFGSVNWGMTTDRGGNDAISDMKATQDESFIYAAGYSEGTTTGKDIILIKYRTNNGAIIWTRYFNRNGSGDDECTSISIDSKDNIFVTGYSDEVGSSGKDFTTLKYDSTGTLLWNKHYNALTNGFDKGTKVRIDTTAKVYVIGEIDNANGLKDYGTIKYDSSGNFIWAKIYNGGNNGNDIVAGIAISRDNLNLYVTGYSDTVGGYDYVTINYDSLGQIIWKDKHNGTGNGNDYATQVEVDYNGNIVVAGTTYEGVSTGQDYTTIKYFPNGTRDWTNVLNSPFNDRDSVTAMHINAINCVYVTGASNGTTGIDFLTILYNTAGWTHWDKRFNYSGTSDDVPYAIDSKGSSSGLTGSTFSSTFDYVTFIYGGIIDNIGIVSYSTPGGFGIYQNYPNPFNPATKIRFDIKHASFTDITVYDIMGRKVEQLVNKALTPGTYEVEWNASLYTSGIYFYRLTNEYFSDTKKMLLVK
jgi:hypothetical protein